MRIAIFSDTFSPEINGVTRNLDRLVNYFSQEGIEYIVFAPESGQKTESLHENKIIRMKSYNFVFYPELKISLPNYLKVKKVIENLDVDLIHLVTPFNIGLLGLYYAKQNDIPLTASYHTNFDQYLDYYNINFIENLAWKYLRWFHNYAAINFCPSQVTLEELKERNFRNLDIWGRGIDTDLFSPDHRSKKFIEENALSEKISILYVGRAAKEKNISLILESLKKLNKKYKNKIELIITGDGPELDYLKKSAPENVIFTGFKKGLELSKIYASADIFAFSSLTETYGNVIIEAMASGLPVVAVYAGGVKENLIDKYNGLKCENDDVDEFASKLEKLILDDNFRKALSHNARNYSLDKTWQSVLEKFVNKLYEVIEDNSDEFKENNSPKRDII